jgi:(E)-4-hydroxy-3-methyl-but-2-enyl pyrophosphate reductase
MEITVARSTGFCSGVNRAISGLSRILEQKGRTYCLGEIIHNPQVVESLIERGMVVVKSIREVPEKSRFVIRSHGLPQDVVDEANKRSLDVLDFTCPKVKKIHTLVKDLMTRGYHCFIAGNPKHPEVQAILSLTGRNGTVVENEHEVSITGQSDRLALVVQTTFNPMQFLNIAGRVISLSKETLVCNTLCEETIKRQREAREIASRTDLVVVVGGKVSSNTKTLYQIAREHAEAVHIETPEELEKEWFLGIHCVGVVSGASTPEETVRDTEKMIHSLLHQI